MIINDTTLDPDLCDEVEVVFEGDSDKGAFLMVRHFRANVSVKLYGTRNNAHLNRQVRLWLGALRHKAVMAGRVTFEVVA